MASSQLTPDIRRNLYFNKYKYRAQCKVYGVCYSHFATNMQEFIKKLEKVNSQSSYVTVITSKWTQRRDYIDLDQIARYFEWKDHAPRNKYLCRVQGDLVSFFSNDIDLLKTLSDVDPNVILNEADLTAPNIMYFKKEPKFKYRTYFKGKKQPDDFKENIKNLSETYKDTVIHFSPSLLKVLFDKGNNRSYYYAYLHGSYYVEYDDQQMITILGLFFPDMLAKTFSCKKQS